MKSITSKWFECVISYDKMQDDGLMGTVTETYVVDASSFTEAEERIIEQISPYISGEYEIKKINKAHYKEVAFADDANADKFFKMKVAFITIDEKSGKEKARNFDMLVEADSLRSAIDNVDSLMRDSMMVYVSLNASATKIIDVFVK